VPLANPTSSLPTASATNANQSFGDSNAARHCDSLNSYVGARKRPCVSLNVWTWSAASAGTSSGCASRMRYSSRTSPPSLTSNRGTTQHPTVKPDDDADESKKAEPRGECKVFRNESDG